MDSTELTTKFSEVLSTKFSEVLSRRGITMETAELFEMSLATPTQVVGFFKENIPSKFQGRHGLIFPIRDLYNKMRSCYIKNPKGTHPKYDSLPFSKDLLFGLNHAYNSILEQDACIMVEGPMDVFALWSHGITNAVAVLGTSVKFSQLCLMKRFAKKCYVLFDGDAIGKAQAQDSLANFSSVGITPIMVSLPKDFDPDDYIMTYGTENFKALLKQHE